MTGSTLYRRLPDGTWAAEREDMAAEHGDVAAEVFAGVMTAGAGDPAPVNPAPRDTAAPVLPPPSAPPANTTKRRGPVRRVLRVLMWLVLAYLAWLIGLAVYAGISLEKIDAASPQPIADTPGTVWLMVGSDSRANLTEEEQSDLHTGGDEGSQRTDTIMLVHLQAGQDPTLVSIPRDSWVTIPAHTASDGSEVGARKAKINAAYAFGGAPLLTETIEYNTGLHVDHYMEVGMGGIVQMTDAVGGIDVCFDEAIKDKNSGLNVKAGCQTLDGATSLAWVRMRYADPKGDLGRIERQQKYVSLMVDEIASPATLLNPVRQWNIVNAVLDSVAVDENSGPLNLGRFGMGMGRIASGSGEITSVPIDESSHWADGQWVIHWDTAEADELFASMGGQTPQASSGE